MSIVVKQWVHEQLVDDPSIEFNRIESNLELVNTRAGSPLPLVFVTNRDHECVFSVDELNRIESNLKAICDFFWVIYQKRTWVEGSIIDEEDMNRWEHFIEVLHSLPPTPADQYVFCGMFAAGEEGVEIF